MLKITNLTKKYEKNNKVAVDNLSFEAVGGKIYGLLGPNGAGKSTTIKCITGILPYQSGTIEVCGHNLGEYPIPAKQEIGYVPDDHVIFEKLTGNEYMNFMADIFSVSLEDRKTRGDKLFKLFELEDARNKQIRSYSHGMKQKITVIGALIHNPKIWILDEPITGLDPRATYVLKELMREHANAGNLVIFSSHVLDLVEKICDEIIIIDNGKLMAACTIDELNERKTDMNLEQFFFNITGENIEMENAQGEITLKAKNGKSDVNGGINQ